VNFEDLFVKTYAAFNARDIEAVLAVLHPDVDWPNGWEEAVSAVTMRSATIGRGNGR